MIIIYKLVNLYAYLMMIDVILSWVPNARNTQVGNFIHSMVEPYVSVFRSKFTQIGMFDFSYIIAFLILQYAQRGIVAFF